MLKRRMLVVSILIGVVMAMTIAVSADDRFEDVPDDNIFHDDIGWLAEEGITYGCNPPDNTMYCPSDAVTRGQMAAFFARALDLPEPEEPKDFTDDDDSVFEEDIEKLAEAGITYGCNPPENTEFCPERDIIRGEMAAFYARALALVEVTEDAFTDDDDSIFQTDIEKIAAAGITYGCNPPDNTEFCPTDPITREQMAAFFRRALENTTINVVHINDHHSHVEAETLGLLLDGQETEAVAGGLPRIATYMNEKAATTNNVLKLHAGDAMTGTLYFSLFEGEADAALMNAICFDAFVLGNHEFDGSDEGLKRFLDWLAEGDCDTDVVSANVVPEVGTPLAPETPNDYFEPYTIKKVGGREVGIIGITIAGKTMNSSSPLDTTQFLDEVATTQRYVDELENMGVDTIMVLDHYQYDNDLALAAAVDGVDAIVGGDSHTLLGNTEPLGLTPSGPYPTRVTDAAGDPVCIVHAWQYSNLVGDFNFTVDNDGVVTGCGGNPVIPLSGEFTREVDEEDVPVTGDDLDAILAQVEETAELELVDDDPAAANILARFAEDVDELQNEVIGTATEDLCLFRIPLQERSEICNPEEHPHGGDIQQIVSQAFLARSFESDIALQNSGGVRIDIPAGDITIGDAYELLPFANTMVNMELSGQEVVDTLEEAIAFARTDSSGAYPYAAGLRWDVDMNQPDGQRVSNVEVKPKGSDTWATIDLAATYLVVTNNFVAEGGDGYETLGRAWDEGRAIDLGLDYAQTFIDYVEQDAGGVLSRPPVEEYSTQDFIPEPSP